MPRGIAAPSVFLCVIAGVFILPSGLSSGIIQGTFPISERTRQAEEDFTWENESFWRKNERFQVDNLTVKRYHSL